MGRWKYEYDGSEYHILHGTTWKRGVAFKSRTVADVLMTSHNADIDAYEVRIKELEAGRDLAREVTMDSLVARCETLQERLHATQLELARVKAESLRVVPVGEPCEYRKSEEIFFLINGTIQAHDAVIESLYGDTIVQPVRLERWEDGE